MTETTGTTDFTLRLDPARARLVAGDYGRVVLVANDATIGAEAVARLKLTPADIVVQFNKAMSFGLFAEIKCHKAHVLNYHPNGGYWGWGTEGRPDPDVHAQAHGELSIYFTVLLYEEAKTYVAGLTGTAMAGVIAARGEQQPFIYPAGRYASAGYMGLSYYRMVNILRLALGRKPLPLVLFGFSGNYPPGSGWKQHDFAYEQLVYQSLVDVTRLSAQGFTA